MNSNVGGSGVEDYTEWIYSTVEILNDKIINSWNYFSSNSNNLNNLPHNLQLSLNEFMDKLSLNGSLPTLPQQWTSKLAIQPPLPSPKISIAKKTLNKLNFEIKNHPYLSSFLLTSTSFLSIYYFYPKTFNYHSNLLLKPLKPFLPLIILPTSDRPKRLNVTSSNNNSTTTTNSNTNEIRKEVALILGAEGLGREIALDLEKKGFVVIATVKNASEVEILEKKSRGWMKVLVLDPTESSSVSPFLRSLSTALSLRYPIHSSGDPFARPSHAISLTSVINCLSLPSTSNNEPLCPLEGMEIEEVKKYLGERIATLVGVFKGILPIMRSMAGRPNAPEGVIVSLLPSNTANFSLPFQALTSATDSAILSILNSLRRELTASKTINLRSTILEVGFFDLPSSTSTPLPTSSSPSVSSSVNLSPRLSSIYTSSLSLHSQPSSSPLSTRSPSPIKSLTSAIFNILIYSRGSSSSRIGAGSTTYWFIGNFIPLGISDNILIFRDLLRRGLRRFGSSGIVTGVVEGAEEVGSPGTVRGSTSLPSTTQTQGQTQGQGQGNGYGTSSQASLNSLASTSTSTSTGSTNNSFFNSTSSPPLAASSSNYTTLNPNRPSHQHQTQNQSNENPFLFEETLQHSTNILQGHSQGHSQEEEGLDVDSEEETNSYGSNSGLLGSFVGSEVNWRDDDSDGRSGV